MQLSVGLADVRIVSNQSITSKNQTDETLHPLHWRQRTQGVVIDIDKVVRKWRHA
jgi:hypothetical protein